ncbi:MAG: hypothetical protein RJA70_4618 [Pseudomonadota bacterium]|jgi:hypothetical protein
MRRRVVQFAGGLVALAGLSCSAQQLPNAPSHPVKAAPERSAESPAVAVLAADYVPPLKPAASDPHAHHHHNAPAAAPTAAPKVEPLAPSPKAEDPHANHH